MKKEDKKVLLPLIILITLELIIYTIIRYGFNNSELASIINFYAHPTNLATALILLYIFRKKE